jgi:hypothetical protein
LGFDDWAKACTSVELYRELGPDGAMEPFQAISLAAFQGREVVIPVEEQALWIRVAGSPDGRCPWAHFNALWDAGHNGPAFSPDMFPLVQGEINILVFEPNDKTYTGNPPGDIPVEEG